MNALMVAHYCRPEQRPAGSTMQQWPAQVDPVHALIEQGAELSALMEEVGDGADQMCSFLQQAPETSRRGGV
jgi:hypothetical protein